MDIKSQIVQNISWTAVESWGGQLLSFLTFAILARLLAPQDFGLVSLAAVFIGFATIFVEQGFGEALIQRKDIEPKHIDSLFWIALFIGVMLTGFCAGFSRLIA